MRGSGRRRGRPWGTQRTQLAGVHLHVILEEPGLLEAAATHRACMIKGGLVLAHVTLEKPGLCKTLAAHLATELRWRRGLLRRGRSRGGVRLTFRLWPRFRLRLRLKGRSGFWLGWRLEFRRRGSRQGVLGSPVGRQTVVQQLLLLAGAKTAQAALPGPVQDVQVAFPLR